MFTNVTIEQLNDIIDNARQLKSHLTSLNSKPSYNPELPAPGSKVRVIGCGNKEMIGKVGVILPSKSGRRRTCVQVLTSDNHALYLKGSEVSAI